MTMTFAQPQWVDGTKRIRRALCGISLLQQFAIITSPILFIGVVGIGLYVGGQVEVGVVRSVASTAALYSKSLFEPHAQELRDGETMSTLQHQQLDIHLSRQIANGSIIGIRLWKNDTIAYSDDKTTIGRSYQPNALRSKASSGTVSFVYSNGSEFVGQSFPSAALWKNVWSEATSIDQKDVAVHDDLASRSRGRPVLEIYAPVREAGTDRIIAVVETLQVPPALSQLLATAHFETWIEIGSVALLTIILPTFVVRRGSKTIDMQKAELEQRVQMLSDLLNENSSLHRKCSLASQRVSEMNEKFLRRLGADLHDGPLQLIGISLLRLDSLDHTIRAAPEEIKSEAQHDIVAIRDALKDSLEELRHVSRGLVPPEIDGMSIEHLIELVGRKHEMRTGLPVRLEIAPLPAHPSYSLKVCIYRIAQQGLANAMQHAGGEGQVVSARYDERILSISVSDRGPGFVDNERSRRHEQQGLSGLRDRVEALGGHFSIDSRPGQGTCILAQFPVEEGLCDEEFNSDRGC
jgi:signal transduction histidine kinase